MQKLFLSLSLSCLFFANFASAQTSDFVDLLWEARTYTPPSYQGKALVTSQSEVKVVAMAQIGNFSPENLVYTWKKDGYNLPANSGAGKNTLVYRAANSGSNTITLEVKTSDDKIKINRTLTLPIVEPLAIIYSENPLLGSNYAQAITGDWTLPDQTYSLRVEPYFFSLNDLLGGKINFSWLVNNQSVTPSSEDGRTLTLQSREGEAGEATVSARVKNTSILRQEAGQDLKVKFGNDDFSFWRRVFPLAQAETKPPCDPKVEGVCLLEPEVLGVPDGTHITSLTGYLGLLFRRAVSFIALLAIVMIVWLGLGYTFNPIPGIKEDAKKRLWNIIKGVFLALAAYIILNQINPDLVSLNFLLSN